VLQGGLLEEGASETSCYGLNNTLCSSSLPVPLGGEGRGERELLYRS